MTTNYFAAIGRKGVPVRFAAAAAVACLLLAGCSANQSLLNLSSTETANPSATAEPVGDIAPRARARIAMAPVVGAPQNVATSFQTQFVSAFRARGIEIATASGEQPAAADYTMRGYIVAARERDGSKVSYIWDILDGKGDRLKRVTGEQMIKGAQARDPWASVSDAVVAQIAARTSEEVAAWLPAPAPKRPQQAPVPVAKATTPALAPPAAVTPPPVQVAAGATDTTRTTTGSLPRSGNLIVVAPRVTGAPGDGSTSLANALAKQLSSNGVALTNSPLGTAHRVNGKVAVGTAASGKQPIQIDWVVTSPDGRKLGTVSQKNEIPAGSLDGAWGQTADAAAGAAAQGIMRLLKQSQTAAN